MITSKILNYHLGGAGNPGINGINGVDLANVSLSRVDNPCVTVFKNNAIADVLSGALNVTRADSSFYLDMYGCGHWVNGEAITNYNTRSYNSNFFGDPNTAYSIFAAGITDPDGGNNASTFEITEDTTVLDDRIISMPLLSVPTDKNLTVQFWAKKGTAGSNIQSIDVSLGDGSASLLEARVVNTGDLTQSWEFFEATFSSTSQAITKVFINPRTTAGNFISVTFVSVSGTNSSIDYLSTNGAIQAGINTSNETRLNNKGLLIEPASNNQCLDSQDLLGNSWSVESGSPVIGKSLSPAPDGFIGDNIAITSPDTNTITLRMTNPLLVDASNYTVSMYANQSSGSGALTCNVGGGTDAVFNGLAGNNEYKRIFANVISSNGGYIDIIITMPANAFHLSLWGIQAELNTMTSYIRNGDTEVGRGTETVKIPFEKNAPQTDKAWSVIWSQGEIPEPITGINPTVFDGLGVGADAWKAYYSDTTDDLIVDNGTMQLIVTDARLGEYIAITFNGSDMVGYVDGVQAGIESTGIPSSFVGTDIVLGSNLVDDHLNSELQNFNIYDAPLNSDDVLYLSGVINAS